MELGKNNFLKKAKEIDMKNKIKITLGISIYALGIMGIVGMIGQ